MTPSLKTLTFPNKLSGDDAVPWSTVFQRNSVSRFFKFLQQRCSLLKKKTREDEGTLLVPDFPRHRPSKDLKGITRFRTPMLLTVHPQKILSLQKTIYITLEYFCIPNPTEGMHPVFRACGRARGSAESFSISSCSAANCNLQVLSF